MPVRRPIVLGALLAAASASAQPTAPIDSTFAIPAWLFPTAAPASAAEPDTAPAHVPNSTRAFTRAQVNDRFAAVDWRPATHRAMPDVVAFGRRPTVIACAFCHLPDGAGRPENATVAGLPAAYIERQVTDMQSGARHSARPPMGRARR